LQRRPFFSAPKETIRINEHIRTYEVRVIDADGKQLGVLTVPAALERAKERGLDLVEVSPTAQPPVCRIMDFGKYKYEISKKAKASKAKQHVIKVKATVVFRGREMAHIEFGARWLKKMTVDLNGIGQAETGSIQEGRNVTTIFAPVKHHVQPVVKPKAPAPAGAKLATGEDGAAAPEIAKPAPGESKEAAPAGQA
jgi:translation initiation factor IF-3